MRRRCASGMVAASAALLLSMACFAHKPLSIGGVFDTQTTSLRIEEINVSQVVYAELTPEHGRLWLTFDVGQATELYLSLGVPVIERLAGYRPNLAVLGPGMPAAELPFSVPTGAGATVVYAGGGAEPGRFHEPFTGTDSWILFEGAVRLPGPGTCYLVAWPPEGIYGKVWVAVGVREAFGWKDIVAFPAIVRDVRAFHEVSPRAPGTLFKGLFLVAASVVIGILVFLSAS